MPNLTPLIKMDSPYCDYQRYQPPRTFRKIYQPDTPRKNGLTRPTSLPATPQLMDSATLRARLEK